MENQKTVELLGIKVANDKAIRLVELDFEKFKDSNVIELIGKNGAGKSTLVDGVKSAISGAKTLKDKELLELGLTHEIKLHDGEYDVYMGFRVRPVSKGVNKGEPKSENYLYTRDKDGKINEKPVLDGISKAEDYRKILITPLTFDLEELYSKVQTTVRKRIEQVYASDLEKLGVDEIRNRIIDARKVLDSARAERDRENAVMEYFKENGWSETQLESLVFNDMSLVLSEIEKLKINRGVLIQNPEKDKEVQLAKIREEGRKIVDEVRELNEKKNNEWKSAYEKWDVSLIEYNQKYEPIPEIVSFIESKDIPSDFQIQLLNICENWETDLKEVYKSQLEAKEPLAPETITIVSGKMEVPDMIPADYAKLVKSYQDLLVTYKKESEKETFSPDTDDIDAKIKAKTDEKEKIESSNNIHNRYRLWKCWVEARGLWEKEIEALRKLYAKIDTGVKGLRIDISEENESHLWLSYNGHHSPEVFGNKKKEYRRLHTYSASQFGIIGILMQAALLDKKKKTARFVVLDNYNMTRESKELIGEVCKEKNIKLLLTRTDDRYDLNNLDLGEVVIDGGELLIS